MWESQMLCHYFEGIMEWEQDGAAAPQVELEEVNKENRSEVLSHLKSEIEVVLKVVDT